MALKEKLSLRELLKDCEYLLVYFDGFLFTCEFLSENHDLNVINIGLFPPHDFLGCEMSSREASKVLSYV